MRPYLESSDGVVKGSCYGSEDEHSLRCRVSSSGKGTIHMADHKPSSSSGKAVSASDPTLLLIESPDRTSVRYRVLAERAGFRLRTAYPGQIASVVRGHFRPDLIVLSPCTGHPGASEIARRLKEDSTTQDIPVMTIVVSDPSDPTLFTRLYPTEACEYDEATDEHLVSTMRSFRTHRSARLEHGPASEPLSPLEGDLAEDIFPGVVEFLLTVRKTGRIVVLNGSKWAGRIYIEDGNVVHAEFAERRGVEAFRKMCFLKHGRFKFEPEFRTAQRTISENGMEILLETARRHDERNGTRPWSAMLGAQRVEMTS